MIEKKKIKTGDLIVILYLAISSISGLFLILSIIWLTLQLKKDPDPNPNSAFIVFIMIIPQIFGIITGIIVWLHHFLMDSKYKKITVIPLIFWILSVITYFVL